MEGKQKAVTIADNEKYLRQISKTVDIKKDKELITEIDELEKYCQKHEVMAMAAVQLGIPKRIIYLKNTNLDIINRIQTNSTNEADDAYNEKRVLINPIILKKEGLTEYWEACASCLNNCGRVLRPYKILVSYQDINNQHLKKTFIGFEATVLSHEIDHLDGILHIDISEEIKIMPPEERKKWRQSHEYKIFYKTGNYDKRKNQHRSKGRK